MSQIIASSLALRNDDASEVVRVFCDSFHEYPVFRYVLAADGDYDERLAKMIGLFVTARVLRNEPMFGVRHDGVLVAAMTTSVPDDAEPAAEFVALRDAVWTELGAAAKARYDQCTAAWQPFTLPVPQHHVNMIGVCHAHQGRGHARLLLHEVHELARKSDVSQGVSLTTEDPRNVTLYQHHGYEVVGQGTINGEIPTWGFFRQRTADAK